MMEAIYNHYINYLIASFGQASATGLSKLLDNKYSHDQITRFLRNNTFTSKDLWESVKHEVKKGEPEYGVLAIDTSIEKKPHSKENALINWHYDHSENRMVKGIGFITTFYANKEVEVPIFYDHIKKSKKVYDKKTKKTKRKSDKSLNEQYRSMLKQAQANKVPFNYALNDIWFASAENMLFIKYEIKNDFVMPIRSNRLVATCKNNQQSNQFVKLESLDWGKHATYGLWLKGVNFPVRVARLVFKNGDGSSGVLYLTTSDLKLTADQMKEIYQKRWKIEVFHKSIKQNASLGKSPTKIVKTQENHFALSMLAYVRLEMISTRIKQNHFAFKNSLYMEAIKIAFSYLKNIISENMDKIPSEIFNLSTA